MKKPHKASKHKSTVAKKKQPLHAEDFIPVRDIRNGIIETTDGRYLRVIEVEPINFLLRNISEQKTIVASFASWMKISPVKVQIKVLTKKEMCIRDSSGGSLLFFCSADSISLLQFFRLGDV